MQEHVEFRKISRIIGWINYIWSIVGTFSSITLIALAVWITTDPYFIPMLNQHTKTPLEKENESLPNHQGAQVWTFGLIYSFFGVGLNIIDMVIAKGLINATKIHTSISVALPLAKRCRAWNILVAVFYTFNGFVIDPVFNVSSGAVYILVIKGFFCYFVHQYIQSLEYSQPKVGYKSGKL